MWLQHDHPCLSRRGSLHIASLGRPTARAAFGGNLSLTWLPHRVVRDERRAATRRHPRGLSQSRVATRGRSRDWLGNADPAMTTQDLAALRWVSDQ